MLLSIYGTILVNTKSDFIFIENLKIDAKIGIYEWEKNVLQPITIDLKLALDITAAAKHDNISATVDYQTIRDHVVALVKANNCSLLESLAENIATYLLTHFAITHVYLKLSKPSALKDASNVGIIIERAATKKHA